MSTKTEERAKILPSEEFESLPKMLPKSLESAAGILRKKYTDLKKYYRQTRKEWPVFGASKM